MMRLRLLALTSPLAITAACANSGVMVGGPGVGVGVGFPNRRYDAFDGDTVVDRLYFGRNIPGGGTVSDGDFAGFLDQVVTPRFPKGLTVLHADGQWQGDSGRIDREQSIVVEIVHAAGYNQERALREIADEYKRRFRQEAVLRVTSPVHVRFYE